LKGFSSTLLILHKLATWATKIDNPLGHIKAMVGLLHVHVDKEFAFVIKKLAFDDCTNACVIL
jgi:hypothetical protein